MSRPARHAAVWANETITVVNATDRKSSLWLNQKVGLRRWRRRLRVANAGRRTAAPRSHLIDRRESHLFPDRIGTRRVDVSQRVVFLTIYALVQRAPRGLERKYFPILAKATGLHHPPLFRARGYKMGSRMPPIPPANRNKNDSRANPAKTQDQSLRHAVPPNKSEQGDTANIKQNTTNKGYFQGRRMK